MKQKHARFWSVLLPFVILHLFTATPAGKTLPVRLYTSADGLGSGFVDYLYRDSRGFMWFCTRDGLSRFDGSRFTTFRIGNVNSPPGIETIAEASDGKYLVTTTGGTYKFDPDALTVPVDGVARIDAERVTGLRGSLLKDRTGTLWIGGTGLFRHETNEGKDVFVKVDLDIPPKPGVTFSIFNLGETQDGSLWIHSTWGLVRRLPDGRKVWYKYDKVVTGGATGFMSDKTGRIWLSLGDELLAFKPEPLETLETHQLIERTLTPRRSVTLSPGEPIELPRTSSEILEYKSDEIISRWQGRTFFQTADGSIWIAAENTLLQINDGPVQLHTDAEGLPSVMVRMAEDDAGNLWIGGQSGLARLDRNGLISYGKQDGLNSSRFFSVSEGQDGGLYFAQRGYYWTSFDGQRFQTVRPKVPETAASLWTSRFGFLARSGDLWFLTTKGLYTFTGGTDLKGLAGREAQAKFSATNGLKSDAILQIFEDLAGDIWISTRGTSSGGHGIARMRNGERSFIHFGTVDGLPDGKSAASFAQDSLGNIWIGFYEGGLARFNGERFTVFGPDNGLPASGHISDIHIDRKGRIWLATSFEGLYRVDNPFDAAPSFARVKIEAANVSSNIRTLTEDRFGRLYLGTARGVDRYSPETGFVKHYSVTDGLASDFVVDSHCDRNGEVWFVTNDGVSRLNPTPDDKVAAPRVFIGSLSIGETIQPVSNLGSLSIEKGDLSSTDNSFHIEYFGLDFHAGSSLRFRYKLEGAAAGWSQPTMETSVRFPNLPPGSYRFLVHAVNTEGASSETPATVSFTILPPIWQRWWFLVFATLIVAFVIYFVYRYRTARLMEINAALEDARRAEERLRRTREDRLAELERVRSRIATDLHDDIGASLTQIAILSEVAQAKTGSGNGAAREPLEKITDVSNELVGTMSDIVWSINPSKDHLSDLTQRMRRFAADVLAPRGITAKFFVPEDGAEIVVNSHVRREVFLVFKEAINNIAKHSEATEVDVRLSINAVEILLAIRDNGKGFENKPPSFDESFTSQGNSGNGIPSMYKRAAEMDGFFEIRSEVGNGTAISLRLRLELAFDDSMIPNSPGAKF